MNIRLKRFLILVLLSFSTHTAFAAAPDAPTDLVSGSGDGEVSLSWLAPLADGGSPITDYQIEYKKTSEASWGIFADGVSTAISATVDGLDNAYEYDFQVAAVNLDGMSVYVSTTETPINPVALAPVAVNLNVNGYRSIGDTLRAVYDYYDENGDAESSSQYQWLIADTVLGPYVPIAGAIDEFYTISASDIGKFITFEITPVSSVSPTHGLPVQASPVELVVEDYINQILSGGHSNSIGTNAGAPTTLSQPYNNVMLSGGFNNSWGTGTSFLPLIEGPWLEGMTSSLANNLTFLSPANDFDVTVGVHGLNGALYQQIKKGTGYYNRAMTQVASAQTAAAALGRLSRVIGVTIVHGEIEHQLGVSAALYQSYLEEWQADYENDVKGITGQEGTIPMFIDQMSSHTAAYIGGKSTSEIPLAQLEASKDNPGKIVLVAPQYFYNYADQVHYTVDSHIHRGEYHAKVIRKVVVDKEDWKPLMPEKIEMQANIISAHFHVPAGELVFDTTIVSPRTHYGFEYIDDMSSADIVSVEIIDADTVEITLDVTPSGSNPRLLYAQNGVAGIPSGRLLDGNAAGNLRDTDPAPSLSGNPLYNWSVHFDEAIDILAPVVKKKKGSKINKSKLKEIFSKSMVDEEVPDVSYQEIDSSDAKYCPLSQNLKKGDKNGHYSSWNKSIITEVEVLQTYLQKNGFDVKYIDGQFGPLTQAAVKKWQYEIGTLVDGFVGPVTRFACKKTR